MTLLPTPPMENLDFFLSHCHRRRYPSKSTIIFAGDKADVLYYIVKGTVCVLVEEQKDNKEMVITYLNAGEFFGEMGLFDDGVRSAWVKAKTDCEICEISYSKFRELSDTNPEFMFALTKQITNPLKETTKKASSLAFLDVTGRVARTLHDLCMQIKITRQEIGRIVVCSREMVGRVLKELEAQGLSSVSGKTMVVYGTR